MDSEIELIRLAKKRDKQAIQILYKSTFKSLYRYIRYKVDLDVVAEDICSEAFVRAFEKIESFRGESSFKTWLYSIARNLIKDWYKDNSKTTQVNHELAEKVEKNNVSDIQIELLTKVLTNLSDRYREVLELRFISKLSLKEVASIMETTTGNVKVLQNRAIKSANKYVLESKLVTNE